MRGLPTDVKAQLSKARQAAILAVETYNRPTAEFRVGAYVVLMILAWSALFLAIFLIDKKKPFVRKKNSTRYVKINGEYKAWDISECLKRYYKGTNNAVRANLEFFIKLRDKLEHRSFPQLDYQVFGECQALLMNFEQLLTQHFGQKHALRTGLVFALQFSPNFQPVQSKSAGRSGQRKYAEILSFINGYRSSLDDEVAKDLQYSFRVFLVPKVNNHPKSADAAIEFVKYDPSRPEEMKNYEHLVTFIKEKQIPVANLGYLKAGEVIKKVAKAINDRFSHYDHMLMYLHFRVRPRGKASNPAVTDTKYCIYDHVHRDYVYKAEWVDFLVDQVTKTNLLTDLKIRGLP